MREERVATIEKSKISAQLIGIQRYVSCSLRGTEAGVIAIEFQA